MAIADLCPFDVANAYIVGKFAVTEYSLFVKGKESVNRLLINIDLDKK